MANLPFVLPPAATDPATVGYGTHEDRSRVEYNLKTMRMIQLNQLSCLLYLQKILFSSLYQSLSFAPHVKDDVLKDRTIIKMYGE